MENVKMLIIECGVILKLLATYVLSLNYPTLKKNKFLIPVNKCIVKKCGTVAITQIDRAANCNCNVLHKTSEV